MTRRAGHGRHAAPAEAPAASDVRAAIDKARGALVAVQRPDGEWCALLETDTSLTSEFILACRHLGRVDEVRERKAAAYLLRRQRPEGGWPIHPSGDHSHDTTIKAYAALRAAGLPPDDPRLARARRLIREHGGIETAAVFTKIHLAIVGQASWDAVPSLPPEMLLLPRTSPFNIYEMSYWCRAIIVPLTIIQALRRPGHLPAERGVPELMERAAGPRDRTEAHGDLFSLKRLFHIADRAIKGLEPMSPRELRRRALEKAERWMLDHLEGSDGLGAIHPAMLNAVHALRALGYSWDHPALAKAWEDLCGLAVETEEECWMQPCLSPAWDTALACLALATSGSAPGDPALVRAADWLLAHRTTRVSDWRLKAPHAPAGAWAFQYRNEHYPDVDDTAMVLQSLRFIHATRPSQGAEAAATGLAWVRAMQGRDGGWGAFDRNNDRFVLQNVPFADHGALLDAPTPDLTGRALELLGSHGFRMDDPAIARGIAWLRREQQPDGSWFGRWGVNYIYGTWSVLAGLEAVGLPRTDPLWDSAAGWIESVQADDGGWGESPDSYVDDGLRGKGPPSASQTAWSLLALLCAGRARTTAVRRGVAWLLREQQADGWWRETEFTGTGFPGVLYLRYHLYPLNFPLLALARFERDVRAGGARLDG